MTQDKASQQSSHNHSKLRAMSARESETQTHSKRNPKLRPKSAKDTYEKQSKLRVKSLISDHNIKHPKFPNRREISIDNNNS